MAINAVNRNPVLEADHATKDPSDWSNEMKNIRKQRLRRQVLQDPSMAARLVAVENSPVYNSRGELIQSLGVNG